MPEMETTSPSFPETKRKASPPKPQKWGYVTPSARATAMAASTAFPPELNKVAPISLAIELGLVTMPEELECV
jgi:hypothetical protein